MFYLSGSDKSIKLLGSIDSVMPLSVFRTPGTPMSRIADLGALITHVALSSNRAMAEVKEKQVTTSTWMYWRLPKGVVCGLMMEVTK